MIKPHEATIVAALLAGPALGLLAIQGCKGKASAGADGGALAASASSAVRVPVFRGFEGELDFMLKASRKTGGAGGDFIPVYLLIKGDKIRAEIPKTQGDKPIPKGHLVVDTPARKAYLVMDEEKQIVLVDLNKTAEELKSFASGLPTTEKAARGEKPRPPPKVTKTAMTDTVADIPCQIWEVADELHKVATLCIADEGASWFHLPVHDLPTEYAWTQELMDGRHFPLRMIAYDKTGAEEGRAELTKLENKPLADVLFQMPAGYKVVDLGAMMGRFGRMPSLPPSGPIPKKHK